MDLITEHLDVWTTAEAQKASGRGKSSNNQSIYGIKKLRELILDLAVRGKLVPQDPDDEPASVLLKKIAEEKAQLLKEGKIKKPRELPVIEENLQPFDIPSTWEWSRLGDVTNYGLTDKVEAVHVNSATWILELEDVEKETSRLLRKVRFREKQFLSSKNKFFQGDVIYGKLRPYLDKVLVADEGGVCTTEMIPFRAYVCVSPLILRLVLKSPYFIQYANESTHGMNLPRLGTEKARLALIPVIPENEQHRIVAKVDELMTLCDQLEQQQTNSNATHQTLVETLLDSLTRPTTGADGTESNVIELFFQHFDTLFTTEQSIDQLKQTILQLAVMGRLVPQDPKDEPASVLLKKIAEEKERLIKAGKIKKQKPLTKISESEKPFELPKGWQWAQFTNLATEISTGPFGTMIHKQDYVYGGTPLINPSHMIDSIIVEDSSITVSLKKATELSSYRLKTGDIILARRGELGRCALVTQRETGWLCGTGSFNLKFHTDVYRKYVLNLFSSEYVRTYLGITSVGATMTNLNHGILNKMPVAVPPVNEQHRIVTKVDELMAHCNTLKTRLSEARTTQVQLADTLVDRVAH